MTENIKAQKESPQEVSFHLATSADIADYIALEERVGKKAGKLYSTITDEAEVAKELAKGPVYLAKLGKRVIGMASYERRADGTAYISGLTVDPDFQGRGIGRKILKKMLAETKDAPSISLLTHPENTAAIALYRSFGFAETSRKDNYFGDGEPRVELTLGQPLGK